MQKRWAWTIFGNFWKINSRRKCFLAKLKIDQKFLARMDFSFFDKIFWSEIKIYFDRIFSAKSWIFFGRIFNLFFCTFLKKGMSKLEFLKEKNELIKVGRIFLKWSFFQIWETVKGGSKRRGSDSKETVIWREIRLFAVKSRVKLTFFVNFHFVCLVFV